MTKKLTRKPSGSRRTSTASRDGAARGDELALIRARILKDISEVRILDWDLCRDFIRERQERDIDQYDEVWEGAYIVPPLATNPHQRLLATMQFILFNVITLESRGQVLAGANVSDRRSGWHRKFRAPDVVVVLNDSRAVDCFSHWMGGPDFLAEVQSPGDETEEKIPFYSQIGVRELLIIHRDTRQLRLYRHDGEKLALVKPSDFQGGKWLVSAVVPLAFRRKALRSGPLTEVQRTDSIAGNWTV